MFGLRAGPDVCYTPNGVGPVWTDVSKLAIGFFVILSYNMITTITL